MGGSKAARARRLRRVLELSTVGMTIPDISAKMKQEGFQASERTVWNDLHSIEAKDYQEEILRKQLVDITIADVPVRLKYRDKLLDKLMPRKIEQKISGEFEGKVKMIDVTEEDLLDVVAPVVDELMARRAKGSDAAVPEEDTEESVG